jgi:hypothetical protein
MRTQPPKRGKTVHQAKCGFKEESTKLGKVTRNLLLAALDKWHAKHGFHQVSGFERHAGRRTVPVIPK